MSQSGRPLKWTVLSQSGRSWTIVDGILRYSGWYWVKVDGHLYESGRSHMKKMDGPEVRKWTVQTYASGQLHRKCIYDVIISKRLRNKPVIHYVMTPNP